MNQFKIRQRDDVISILGMVGLYVLLPPSLLIVSFMYFGAFLSARLISLSTSRSGKNLYRQFLAPIDGISLDGLLLATRAVVIIAILEFSAFAIIENFFTINYTPPAPDPFKQAVIDLVRDGAVIFLAIPEQLNRPWFMVLLIVCLVFLFPVQVIKRIGAGAFNFFRSLDLKGAGIFAAFVVGASGLIALMLIFIDEAFDVFMNSMALSVGVSLLYLTLRASLAYLHDRKIFKRTTRFFSPDRLLIAEHISLFRRPDIRLEYVRWIGVRANDHLDVLADPRNSWPGGVRPNFGNDQASELLAQLDARWLKLDI